MKAWEGPLPADAVGVEFYTNVEPDPWSVPGWPEWTEGRPGVIVLQARELVAIPVVVTMSRSEMRAAEPHELQTHAYPLLTAAISEAELAKWFPVPFHRLTDPRETAEPSKAALIQLDAGDYFVLYYGELSNQLMLRIATATDPARFLQAFFREVPLPHARIVWRRQDATLPQRVA